MDINDRESWKTRIGLILAVAGQAVGLGNFLRFPVQAAENGGGAFLIPYFIFFILLGIPLMWIEWALGRYGGQKNHGTTPGMFHSIWKHKVSKYLGVLGIFIPLILVIYYTYITSWTLGFSFFSITKKYFGITEFTDMKNFLYSYQGRLSSEYFGDVSIAYIFMIITFICVFFILYKGISKGIERLAKIAMPLLFFFAIIVVIRVVTIGTPDPSVPENSIESGFAFIWNPNFSMLGDPKIWLAAAGQIFFTLSVGMGTIQVYTSYMKPDEDIALSGLTTATTNEFAEVILGASIAIPISVAFFGINGTTAMAEGGAFDLGFASLPLVFQQIPLGEIFGFLWFLLLFFAGITSSVSQGQPIITFLQDEFGLSRKRAVFILSVIVLISVQFVVFFLRYGFLDEMDYWAGTFGLVIFALIESILFMWIFGGDNAWSEINKGAEIKIPRFFYYILKYVTPLILFVVMIWWFVQDAFSILMLDGANPENVPYIWASRIFMLILLGGLLTAIHFAWKKEGVKDGI